MPILQGKVALVTGAGAGIGWAIALAFANEGEMLAAADIDPAAAQKTASDAAGNPVGCTVISARISNYPRAFSK